MSSKRSKVHPTFKTKYRVGNWREYDAGLVDRGDLTVWISQEAVDSWSQADRSARRTAASLRHGDRGRADSAALVPPPASPDRGVPAMRGLHRVPLLYLHRAGNRSARRHLRRVAHRPGRR